MWIWILSALLSGALFCCSFTSYDWPWGKSNTPHSSERSRKQHNRATKRLQSTTSISQLHSHLTFFALRLSITSSWSNSSDSEAGEKLPGAAWLLYLWPLVFDLSVQLPSESYCSELGGGEPDSHGPPRSPSISQRFISRARPRGVEALKHVWFHL